MQRDPVPFRRLPDRGAVQQKPLLSGLVRMRTAADVLAFTRCLHAGIDLGLFCYTFALYFGSFFVLTERTTVGTTVYATVVGVKYVRPANWDDLVNSVCSC